MSFRGCLVSLCVVCFFYFGVMLPCESVLFGVCMWVLLLLMLDSCCEHLLWVCFIDYFRCADGGGSSVCVVELEVVC